MLRLSKLTDYAIVVLGELARANDAQHSTAELARRTGVPEPTVAKVTKLLARGGIVRAARGAAGGYRLARPATEVSMSLVIEMVEGPIALTSCVDGAPGDCAVQHICAIRGNWDPVNRAIHTALSEVTLADMVRAQRPAARPAVQIEDRA